MDSRGTTTQGTALSPDVARRVVEAATLAPSIHNSQPWRWRVADGALELYADPSRHLSVIDPTGRQMLLSCGAALLHARLALRELRLDPHVDLMPDAGSEPLRGGLLARITIVGTRPPSETEAAWAQAMHTRHTDRRPFQGSPLDRATVKVLRDAAESEGAWLVSLDDPDRRIDASVLIARADWVETHDPSYAEELRTWSRDTPGASDGIPRSSVVGSGDGARQSEFLIRDFDVVGEPGVVLAGPEVERPTVVMIGTSSDTDADALRAGQALAAVLLAATSHGVASSPLGQAVDVDSTRALLRNAVGGLGNVQMLLRVGYPKAGTAPVDPTPRRPVSEVLDS